MFLFSVEKEKRVHLPYYTEIYILRILKSAPPPKKLRTRLIRELRSTYSFAEILFLIFSGIPMASGAIWKDNNWLFEPDEVPEPVPQRLRHQWCGLGCWNVSTWWWRVCASCGVLCTRTICGMQACFLKSLLNCSSYRLANCYDSGLV